MFCTKKFSSSSKFIFNSQDNTLDASFFLLILFVLILAIYFVGGSMYVLRHVCGGHGATFKS